MSIQTVVPSEVPHGTRSGYQYHGCRCDYCRAANRDYFRAWRAAPRARKAGPAHGTRNCYVHHGCRCDSCRAANGRYVREWRARRRDQSPARPAAIRHGTPTGYVYYRCRCDSCRAANAEYRRRLRAERCAHSNVCDRCGIPFERVARWHGNMCVDCRDVTC